MLVLLLGVPACSLMAAKSPALAGLDLSVTTDKTAYAPGEPIVVTLRMANRGVQPKTLHFRTAQRYDVLIEDAQNRRAWQWSEGQLFAQVLGEETVGPGQERTYRVSVRARLARGAYTLTGVVPSAEGRLLASVAITTQ